MSLNKIFKCNFIKIIHLKNVFPFYKNIFMNEIGASELQHIHKLELSPI